jgi:hypothetical protein
VVVARVADVAAVRHEEAATDEGERATLILVGRLNVPDSAFVTLSTLIGQPVFSMPFARSRAWIRWPGHVCSC